MDWMKLNSEAQIDQIRENSKTKPQVIFKHSTRCGISSMALNRLERTFVPVNADFYLLDLLSYREISNRIALDFKVPHESPQVLVIIDEKCVYDESHSGINMDIIQEKTGFRKA